MIKLTLNTEIHFLSPTIKEILWKFVRGDLPVRDFEQWVYSNENNILRQIFGDDSYLELAMLDYKNRD